MPREEETHDPLEQLREWQQRIAALPEPVSYIVLDHSWDGRLPHVVGHDAQGRKYALCSPAILDEARYLRSDEGKRPLFGISVYRREQMPEGWPDA